MSNQHPRPRIGKTRDDRLPADKRTRGGRQERDKAGRLLPRKKGE